MRFVLLMAVVLILDRIRRGSVLFLSHRLETNHAIRPTASLAAISAELVPANATSEGLGN
jgi:hypothetical protein